MAIKTMSAKQEYLGINPSEPRRDSPSIAGTPPAAIKLWAGIGAIILSVFAWTLFKWVTSPYFKPSPVGSDPISNTTMMWIHVTDIFCGAFSLGFLYWFIIKPWRKQGELTWDGMLAICFVTEWVLDPICNYFNFTFTYNAYFVNMGSWASFLPGWQSPLQENFPEPLLLMGGIYLWWTTINVLAAGWTMKKLRVSMPQYSIIVHAFIAYLVIVVLDMILELPACRLGLFAYPGAPAWFTLWAGEPYQFPVYETLFMNFNYISIAVLRHYRDDKGLSMVERGVSTLTASKPKQKFLRFLALAGFVNTSYFITYFMPYNWMALQADTFPAYPSYMRAEICGKGTPYACPSREVPIPSRKSLAITPDDPRLSMEARQN